MTGWGGAGAFSDGKLTLTTEVGGWLGDYVGTRSSSGCSSTQTVSGSISGRLPRSMRPMPATVERLGREAGRAGMRLVPMSVRHMGRTESPAIALSDARGTQRRGVEVRTDVRWRASSRTDGSVTGGRARGRRPRRRADGHRRPGREGADWMASEARRLGDRSRQQRGRHRRSRRSARRLMEPLTDPLYEAKLVYTLETVRRPRPHILHEPVRRGHDRVLRRHHDRQRPLVRRTRTANTNFAVLVSQMLHRAVRRPDRLRSGRSPSSRTFLPTGIIVQRCGDLKAGRRSTPARIAESVVAPTIDGATPGDLAFVLPYRHLADILEFIEALDELAPGVAAPDTLLYGVEVKFYSSRVEVGPDLQTSIVGLYAVGDGAGITRGLVQ